MRILVLGGGIGGLFAGQILKQKNYDFKIIEKSKQFNTTGAGIALPANAVKMLRNIGMGDKIDNIAHQVQAINYTKPSGTILSKASLLEPPLNTDKFVALHRSKLHKMLMEGLEDSIIFNATMNDINREDYDLIICAEGIHSATRQALYPDIQLADLQVTNWRWTVKSSTRGLQPTYMLGAQSVFMAYPISDDEIYCYAHLYDPEKLFYKKNPHDIFNEKFISYGGIFSQLQENISQQTDIIPGRLCSMPTPVFGKGNIAIVGDASSACSPMLQQGAASAFEDIFTLIELLECYSPEEAIKHYSKIREPRVNWILKNSDEPMKLIANIDSFFKLVTRNLMIRKNGPLNVLGWKKLLAEDPFERLQPLIQAGATKKNRI